MDTDVFSEWFEKFANENQVRPLLLLSDGHLTHISLSVIKRAMEERIIIIKFAPHVTHVLQSLDVAYLGPLKHRWELLLQNVLTLMAPNPI